MSVMLALIRCQSVGPLSGLLTIRSAARHRGPVALVCLHDVHLAALSWDRPRHSVRQETARVHSVV
jgi:hypothetical protein